MFAFPTRLSSLRLARVLKSKKKLAADSEQRKINPQPYDPRYLYQFLQIRIVPGR